MEGNLISEVCKYPSLYDQSLDTYKDSELKNKIWSKIAQKILGDSDSESVEKIKTRWKSLRDSFLRNLKKTGLQGNKKIKPWKYTEQMQFLLPYICAKSFVPIKEEMMYDEAPFENGDGSQDVVESDECRNNGDEKHSNNKRRSIIGDKNLKKLKHDRHRTIPVSAHYLQALLLNCEKGPIDSFFLGIAQTVKKLSPVNQAFIKKAVANMVIDTEINELEESKQLNNTDLPNIYEPTVDLKVQSMEGKPPRSSSSASESSCSVTSDP